MGCAKRKASKTSRWIMFGQYGGDILSTRLMNNTRAQKSVLIWIIHLFGRIKMIKSLLVGQRPGASVESMGVRSFGGLGSQSKL